MTRSIRSLMFIIVIASFLLAACAGAATPQTITQVQTQIVNQVVTATPDGSQPTQLPAGSVQINGAGATFPLPIYTEWTYVVEGDSYTIVNGGTEVPEGRADKLIAASKKTEAKLVKK